MKRMQFVAFLVAVAFIQWLIALPFLVDKLGGTYETIGFLIGTSSVCYAAGSLLLHRFVMRFGYRRLLWMALPLLGASTALCGFVPNLPLLFAVVALLSIVLALFWTSWECMFSSQEQEGGLLRNLMKYCLGFTSGDIVGSWVGTALVYVDFGVPWLRLRLPFLLAGTTICFCMGLLSWIERSGKLKRGYSTPELPIETLHSGERFLPASRTIFFFVFCIAGITLSFVPLMVAKEMSEWAELSSRVIALQPLVQGIVFLAFGLWGRWVHKSWPLWFCALALIVATALLLAPLTLPLSHQLGAWCLKLGLCLVGVAVAVSFLMNLLYSMERPDTRARNAGIHEAIVGLGMMAGPALGGFGARLAGNKGVGAFWVALGLAWLGLVAFQAIWLATRRRTNG